MVAPMSSRAPSVAVLLSTYNGERFLAQQLDSLCAQRAVELALYVRDDGSSDGTLAVLQRYAARWPSLARITTHPNLGAPRSFMELLASVPGDHDYYAFCDQDDVWLPEKLARAAAWLGQLPAQQPSLYCGRVMSVDMELNELGPADLETDVSFEHTLFESIGSGCAMVMNRAAHALLARAVPRRIAMHDWWCALVIAAFGQVVYDETPTILYRQHGGNVVGARGGELELVLRHLRKLRRDPTSLYPIHAQASELLRLYGDELPPQRRRRVEALVRSKRSLLARLRYALAAPVVRTRKTDVAFARGLMMLGWY